MELAEKAKKEKADIEQKMSALTKSQEEEKKRLQKQKALVEKTIENNAEQKVQHEVKARTEAEQKAQANE